MKKNFKLVSLLTIFTVVLNVLSVLVLMRPATALSNVTVGSTSQTAGAAADYTVNFTTDNTTTVSIIFPTEYTGAIESITPVECTIYEFNDHVIICTGQIPGDHQVVVSGFINPVVAGTYSFRLVEGSSDIYVDFAIVDSYEVYVNGYINSSLSFDIDTTTASDNQECSPTTCLAYEGYIGDTLDAYTVDLGNLTTGAINKSEDASVLHADGGYGLINSIYFDLSTNAIDGAIVTVISMNKGLDSADDTIAATTTLSVGSEGYGINVSSAGSTTADCSGATYCNLNGAEVYLFHTDAPVEGARVIAAVAAAVSPLTNPGTYTDTLTFVATATF